MTDTTELEAAIRKALDSWASSLPDSKGEKVAFIVRHVAPLLEKAKAMKVVAVDAYEPLQDLKAEMKQADDEEREHDDEVRREERERCGILAFEAKFKGVASKDFFQGWDQACVHIQAIILQETKVP